MDPSNGGAAAGLVGFELAVEMIGVRPLRLIFPRHSRARDAQGGEDVAIVRPSRNIGTAATMVCRAVGGSEPHRLTLGEHSESGPIGSTHADVGPVVSRIDRGVAVLKGQPLPVGRPAGPEIQMTGLGGDLHPVAPVGVASPDLVAFATGQMEGHAPSVWAEAVTVGQSFVRAGELAGLRTI